MLLLPPTAVEAWFRRDRLVGVLLALTLPGAVVQAPLIAATTSSGPLRAVYGATLAPLLLVEVLAWLRACARAIPAGRPAGLRPSAVALCAALGLAPLIAVGSLDVFAEKPGAPMTAAVSTGAWAGTRGSKGSVSDATKLNALIRQNLRPGDSLLMLGCPGGYLLGEARPDTPILWLERFGPANQVSVDWFERTGRHPDVIIVADAYLAPGRLVPGSENDPLLDLVAQRYVPAGESAGFVHAFVRADRAPARP